MRRNVRNQKGFTFIEVLLALSILVVGSTSILALFLLGVDAQVRRRIDARELQVRPEVQAILQAAVNAARPGQSPAALDDVPLSVPGYGVDVVWQSVAEWAAAGGRRGADVAAARRSDTFIAQPFITLRGDRVKALGPHVVSRTVFDPGT